MKGRLTIDAGVIRFYSDLRDLSVLSQESIPLAAVVAEDGRTVEGKVELLGESSAGVA